MKEFTYETAKKANTIARQIADATTLNAVRNVDRKMKNQSEIDWEQRRYEVARDMMAAFLSNSCSNVYAGGCEEQAKHAVMYADALIAELKKGEAQ